MGRKVRINMTIDEDLHRTYQRICGKTGQTFSGLVSQILLEGLPHFLQVESFIDQVVKAAEASGGHLDEHQAEALLSQLKARARAVGGKQLEAIEQMSLFGGELNQDQAV